MFLAIGTPPVQGRKSSTSGAYSVPRAGPGDHHLEPFASRDDAASGDSWPYLMRGSLSCHHVAYDRLKL